MQQAGSVSPPRFQHTHTPLAGSFSTPWYWGADASLTRGSGPGARGVKSHSNESGCRWPSRALPLPGRGREGLMDL